MCSEAPSGFSQWSWVYLKKTSVGKWCCRVRKSLTCPYKESTVGFLFCFLYFTCSLDFFFFNAHVQNWSFSFWLSLFLSAFTSLFLLSLSSFPLWVDVDPPSVITEQFACVRKAWTETALSDRLAISALLFAQKDFGTVWVCDAKGKKNNKL